MAGRLGSGPALTPARAAVQAECRAFATEQIDQQREDFKRLGVLGDWERPYRTMDFANEAGEIRAFKRVIERGFVYRGLKPVYWCFDCGSSLAEFEIEYADKKSDTLDVAFLCAQPDKLAKAFGLAKLDKEAFAVIWTTTAWTIPANQALNLNPELDYALVDTERGLLLLASALVDTCLARYGLAGTVLATWDPLTRPIITEFAGRAKFENVEEGVTVAKQVDEVTGLATLVVIDPKRRGSAKVVRPQVKLIDASGAEVKIPGTDHSVTIGFQIGSLIQVRDGMDVGPGEVLARIPVEGQKTRDITGGLPRVAELFEARSPKDKGMLAEMTGTVSFGKETKGKVRLQITDPAGKVWDELIPKEKNIVVHEGQVVNKGESVVDGPADPQDILRLLGMEELARYIVDEVQDVYRLQGVKINDKHIEVIVRQMLRRVVVENIGESNYISGEQVERSEILNTNDALRAEGKIPATFSNLLLGITKASLSTDSFISAASFQETTRVLTEAAIMGKRDELRGLKENVIVGRLIPAGTGLAYHKARAAKDAMDEAERRAITEAEAVELAEAQQLTEDAANAADSKA